MVLDHSGNWQSTSKIWEECSGYSGSDVICSQDLTYPILICVTLVMIFNTYCFTTEISKTPDPTRYLVFIVYLASFILLQLPTLSHEVLSEI